MARDRCALAGRHSDGLDAVKRGTEVYASAPKKLVHFHGGPLNGQYGWLQSYVYEYRVPVVKFRARGFLAAVFSPKAATPTLPEYRYRRLAMVTCTRDNVHGGVRCFVGMYLNV